VCCGLVRYKLWAERTVWSVATASGRLQRHSWESGGYNGSGRDWDVDWRSPVEVLSGGKHLLNLSTHDYSSFQSLTLILYFVSACSVLKLLGNAVESCMGTTFVPIPTAIKISSPSTSPSSPRSRSYFPYFPNPTIFPLPMYKITISHKSISNFRYRHKHIVTYWQTI